MGHSTAHPVMVVGALVVCALLADQSAAVEAASHPDEAWTLSLLGYSLDNQMRSRAGSLLLEIP